MIKYKKNLYGSNKIDQKVNSPKNNGEAEVSCYIGKK